jgi:DNA modification methylase
MNKVLKGDALTVLKTLPSEFINCTVTSPPYWGLRDYGIEPIIWDGDADCEHEWGNSVITLKHKSGETNPGKESWFKDKGASDDKGSQFCSKCGAWKGSLGLESTFELYIKHLCDIFDETKRVLRNDGTLWVNLGDSYSGSNNGSNDYREKDGLGLKPTERYKGQKPGQTNLPSKSLCLIPFRFAIEMTKRRGFVIKNELDRAWLAGIIEGEGCIHIHKRTNGRKNPTYGLFLSIHNTNKKMIDRVVQLTGLGGNIQTTRKDRNFTLYRWNAMSDNAKMVLREVYPYLITKRDQARCALYCPSSGNNAEECWDNIKRMHNYKEPTREYPEPEVGGIDPWILRNVIIWKKPNCMPSSAKDRFTVDFEYLFFFVKNKKYWFEQQIEDSITPAGKVWNLNTPKTFGGNGHLGNSTQNKNRKDWVGNGNRNKRTVWTIPTKPYPEAHFAVYPAELIRTCIKAGCPRYVCKKCGKAREKIYETKINPDKWKKTYRGKADLKGSPYKRSVSELYAESLAKEKIFQGYSDCGCNAGFRPGVVLDPFAGSGTTLEEAIRQGKDYIGIELKDDYIDLINKRLSKVQVSLI